MWLPARLEGEGVSTGFAVSQDVSKTGVLIAVADELEVGATLTLTFESPGKEAAHAPISGRIVRVEANSEDPYGLWPHRVAVEFDEPVPELAESLEEAL